MSSFDETDEDILLAAAPGTAPADWELAAAAAELAFLSRSGTKLEGLPADLTGTIQHKAPAYLPQPVEPRWETRGKVDRAAHEIPDRSWLNTVGWWTAACLAGLLIWQGLGIPRDVAPNTEVSPALTLAQSRSQLLDQAQDVVTVAWTKASDDPSVIASQADLETAGNLGDVVWSSDRQQGFMRFRGLAVNDPTVSQYQLWIFDAERNEAHPVDGGVFDVPANAEDDVVVPIDPRIPVHQATAFAITVERPGGVVVSSRERLPLLAALP
jgi:hypothetical protein